MDKLIFNRVPKVGSEQMIDLIKKLSRINGFKYTSDDGQNRIMKYMSHEKEKALARKISKLPDVNVYVRHINYINFEAYNFTEPIYINMVRDPIERAISWFYFKRSPWIFLAQRLPEKRPLPNISSMKKKFEECVLMGDEECTYIPGRDLEGIGDHRRQTLFFCGQHRTACMPFNMEGPLELAKRRVEEKYAVVGTWEDTNITLSVLEEYIPRYFRGASTIYNLWLRTNIKKNSNPFKPKISEKVKEMMRKNFTREIEFYQFCRQRLHKQYLAIKLKDFNID